VVAAIDGVLAELTRLGATVVPVTMPDVGGVSSAWFELCATEALAANARTFPSRASEYGPGFRPVLAYGQKVTRASLAAASKIRSEVSASLERLLNTVDGLVCPSMANAARTKEPDPFAEESDTSWSRLVRNDIHTKPFNFSGSPTLSVPCGFSADGLPLSVQFVGRRLSESELCRMGHAYEHATQWHSNHPRV
jgi:amidase